MTRDGGYAAVDVHYLDGGQARAALVTAAESRFSQLTAEKTVLCTDVEPYRSGQFYLRELPPVRAVCAGAGPFELIVIDGYVDLDPAGQPGLGAYVHAEFGVPVIGVAKSPFVTATHAVRVTRGQSHRPLYITSAGCPVSTAASMVREMAGPHRIPDALRRADRLARGLDRPAG
jgi:deoxyribonuclease V